MRRTRCRSGDGSVGVGVVADDVELVGHGLEVGRRIDTGLRAQVIEGDRDVRLAFEQQDIAAHVLLQSPGQRRLALVGVAREVFEQVPVLVRGTARDVTGQGRPQGIERASVGGEGRCQFRRVGRLPQ